MEAITLIVKNIARHRKSMRVVFILIVISTIVTIGLAAAASGTEQSTMKRLSALSDITQIRVGPPITTQQNTALNDSTLGQLTAMPGVEKAVPLDYISAQIAFGPYVSYPSLIGVGLDDLVQLGYTSLRGDTIIKEKQIIIGNEVPNQFVFKNLPGKTPGQGVVDIQGKFVKVILEKMTEDNQTIRYSFSGRISGILKATGTTIDYSAFMPITDSGKLKKWLYGQNFRQNTGYDSIIVIVNRLENVQGVHKSIVQAGFQAESRLADIQQIRDATNQLNKFAFIVGVISLLSSLAGMFLTMLTVITERKAEIGLMKAVGATDREVLRLFVGEAGMIGFLGGMTGVALSLLLQAVLNYYIKGMVDQPDNLVIMGLSVKDIVLNIPFWLLLAIPLFSTISCILAGLWPAMRASALNPIDALRAE
ncbi:MAG: FtsX-like permease family protein [Chloroflexota bacterium]